METVLNNSWLSAIIGVIVGSAINHVFWLVQSKKQIIQQIRSERLKRIDEICDFCSTLIEKSKKVYGLTVTGQAMQYFSEIENFWASVPFYKIRMIVKFHFPKCTENFDDLQISSAELVKLMQLSMAREQITKEMLDSAFSNIDEKTSAFQNCLITVYSKELCLN